MTDNTISDAVTMQGGAEATLLAGRFRVVRQLGNFSSLRSSYLKSGKLLLHSVPRYGIISVRWEIDYGGMA